MEHETPEPSNQSEKGKDGIRTSRKNIKFTVKRRQRGKRKSAKSIKKNIRFLGVNAAGLRPKLTTFKKIVSELKPSLFFIEETKYKDEGKLKVDNYSIFEKVRESRDGGGGLAIGCEKDLHPVWVREGEEDVETLSIEISVKAMKIRCVIGYGCQENDKIDKKKEIFR